MSLSDYLAEPFFELQAYRADPPQDAVSFTGSPRQHPYDDGKIILIAEPHEGDSAVLEFRASDVVCAQDLPSPVTESGESYRIVRLWIRRGAVGLRYEPFEVDQPLRYMGDSRHLRDKVLGRRKA